MTIHPHSTVAALLLVTATAGAQVTTAQHDNARTGAILTETQLTPANVNARQFGKLLSLRVTGDVYAEPLFLPGLPMPDGRPHDVLFVATEQDDVYAFDAAGPSSTPLWHASFTNAQTGVTPVPARDVRCGFINPDVGITSTPVIDSASGTIYVLARTRERGAGGQPTYAQRLHALDVRTGAEKFGGPVVISASVPGPAGGRVVFDPLIENPRAALLLDHGRVYLSWASSCDVGAYHGWVIAYDAHTLAQLGAFNATPDGAERGIWQGQAGIAADETGAVFAVTGNGTFDVDKPGGHNYGDTVLRLSFTGHNPAVSDYFTPFDQKHLDDTDADLGSGGPLLLPARAGARPNLLIVGGKGGVLYVIDRDRMGHFHAGDDSHAVQTIRVGGMLFGAGAYWNGHVYVLNSNSALRDYAVQSGSPALRLVGEGPTTFTDPGATPTISANGARDGIVWVIETKGWASSDRHAVLHAYDAARVSRELYASEQNSGRDRAGTALRFTIPTVANGRVYVSAKGEVDVYGLLTPPR